MRSSLAKVLTNEAKKRWSLIATAALVTARPSAFIDRVALEDSIDLRAPLRFFLISVGVVLAIEAAFSFVFDTAFSDLVHHLFPAFVALTGGIAIYVVLKLLFTRNVRFASTLEGALYVGGTALLVMITAIFLLLAVDFASNYHSVMASSCGHRTIMCLLSGNLQYDYDLPKEVVRTPETQGWSLGYILLIIFAALFYYTHVLSTVLKRRMGVARWRTYVASFVAVVLLSPVYLFLLNTIYRALYGNA
jgi:hypothetical protein